MNKHWQRGKLGLVGVSAAAIAAAAVPDDPQRLPPTGRDLDLVVDRAAARTAAPKAPARAALHLDLERLKRLQPAAAPAEAESAPPAAAEAPPAPIANAFAAQSWYVPPPPPPPAAALPPPKPTAPPLPFTYMGRFDEAEKPTVIMLVRGDRLYTVAEGDVIDGTYRIEKVARGVLELIYLPLQETQSLAIGEAG